MSQRRYREQERYLTILTAKHGIVEARLRIFGQINRQNYNNISVMGYYQFDLFEQRQRYTVNAAEKIEDFYMLRNDAQHLALGEYFCELIDCLHPERFQTKATLQLLLNSLYLLMTQKRTPQFLKPVFELRSLSILGFMPDLVGCESCGAYNRPPMSFFPQEGVLLCSACAKKKGYKKHFVLMPSTLHAMRYILYKEDNSFYNFKLSAECLAQLGDVVEYYTILKTDRNFRSLTVFRQLS